MILSFVEAALCGAASLISAEGGIRCAFDQASDALGTVHVHLGIRVIEEDLIQDPFWIQLEVALRNWLQKVYRTINIE